MRVFLPWKAVDQSPYNSDSEDEHAEIEAPFQTVDEVTDEPPCKRSATCSHKLPPASVIEDAEDSPKRPRLDSKPSAIEMTAGPLRKDYDSDEEKLPATAHWLSQENKSQDALTPTILTIRSNQPDLRPSKHHAGEYTLSVNDPTEEPVEDDDVKQEPTSFALNFDRSLRQRGLEIVPMAGDGNCLFRAVALQVYGDVEMHSDVRAQVCDFMERDVEHFGAFLDEPLSDYINRKRRDGVHGNNPEIQAVSELFNRPVEVFTPDNGAEEPLNIFQKEYATQDQAIRLSYHDGNHYNAVVDPLKPTAGLGLGMPGLKIGLADELQVSKAIEESDLTADQLELERTLEKSTEDEVQRVMKETSLYNAENDDVALQLALKESAYDVDYVSLLFSRCVRFDAFIQ
jgi:OTU domain-containing protein 5